MTEKTDTMPAIIDGVRTPFMRSHKAYVDLRACDLGRFALSGLMDRLGIDDSYVEHLAMGTVIHDPHTPNIARECLLAAGLRATIPAHTVSLACISSNMASTNIADMIRLGRIEVGIAAGVDTCSDPPIRLSPGFRHALVRWQKLKKPAQIAQELMHLKNFELADLALDAPSVAEFSNGKTMGEGCEILAQIAGVNREESDRYAARSHILAVKALKDKVFADNIVPVQIPPAFKTIDQDDGPRADTTPEKLAKLSPAFDRTFGVNTAGNSSFLTDGASAMLMTSVKRAKELGFQAKAILADYVYQAGNVLQEMLTGPAFTIPVLLNKNKLKIDDIDVWEIHEAFASQMVANMKLLKSPRFLQERLGFSKTLGEIPLEKLNVWGGSLSLGHPFGATGVRLLFTAAKRLQEQNARYAVVAGCAAGGHGSAILLENPNFT
ncbi:MAG: acetyl-CoA C-acyltransferase [Deltaproteobacteria bacterium]|nr:acetyl-CoA C-acyltransferase [Deltaproteobacteria bacterium]